MNDFRQWLDALTVDALDGADQWLEIVTAHLVEVCDHFAQMDDPPDNVVKGLAGYGLALIAIRSVVRGLRRRRSYADDWADTLDRMERRGIGQRTQITIVNSLQPDSDDE